MSNIRFGPYPESDLEWHHLHAGNELGRIIRETLDRMRRPLWFWEVELSAGRGDNIKSDAEILGGEWQT